MKGHAKSRAQAERRAELTEPMLVALAEDAFAVDGDAGCALELARSLGSWVPKPGEGRTNELFEILATLAVCDLTAARVAEAHLDALSILAQAGMLDDIASLGGTFDEGVRTWGVFAAEGAGTRVDARVSAGQNSAGQNGAGQNGAGQNGAGPGNDIWRLNGTKPWCSLAGSLSHALVTAHTDDGHRGLFAVALTDAGVTVHESAWVARGLSNVPSGPVDFADVAAVPVGANGWYLQRPGFAWGGIGVAACWWGGAVGVARALHAAAQAREPDQIALAHLGAVDILLNAVGLALADAAAAVDAEADSDAAHRAENAQLLAARVRGLVARTVDEVIARVGHGLGPAPLAVDERHARRVADLQLYVRQHHAERDDAALGRVLLNAGRLPW